MATVMTTTCDRCGAIIQAYTDGHYILRIEKRGAGSHAEKQIDLCETCILVVLEIISGAQSVLYGDTVQIPPIP